MMLSFSASAVRLLPGAVTWKEAEAITSKTPAAAKTVAAMTVTAEPRIRLLLQASSTSSSGVSRPAESPWTLADTGLPAIGGGLLAKGQGVASFLVCQNS